MLARVLIFAMFGLFTSALFAQENLDHWLEQYKSPKSDDRIEAVLKVGEMLETLDEVDAEKAYEFMFQAFADRTSLVQSAAKVRLAQRPDGAVPYLKKFIDSEKERDFLMACEAIKSIGPEAKIYLPGIVKRLDGKVEHLRLAALHAMRVMDGEDLLPYLDQVIAALDSENFNVQLSACRVIIQIGEPAKKAGPRLVKLMEEGIVSARSWASIALGAIGPHEDYDVVDLLSQKLPEFYLVDRERALIGLAYLGPNAKKALPAVEKLMVDESKSVEHVAARTRWKITGDADKSVEVLIKLLPTMEHGADSMDILAEMEGAAKKAVPFLIEQTLSTEAASREGAVYALAAIGAESETALPRLKKIASKDKDRMIREAAKLAIESIHEAKNEENKKEGSSVKPSDSKAGSSKSSGN